MTGEPRSTIESRSATTSCLVMQVIGRVPQRGKTSRSICRSVSLPPPGVDLGVTLDEAPGYDLDGLRRGLTSSFFVSRGSSPLAIRQTALALTRASASVSTVASPI